MIFPFQRATRIHARLEIEVKSNTKGENNMKTIIRIVLASLLLVACGSAPVLADTSPVPLCYPKACPPGN
jgi:hypothetical protein